MLFGLWEERSDEATTGAAMRLLRGVYPGEPKGSQ